MKKILTHLTGIVFLIAILVAGGCKEETQQTDLAIKDYNFNKVTIFVKVIENEEAIQLEMYDSNDSSKVIDDHIALVKPGTNIIWRRANDSGIKKFKRIYPKDKGIIMEADAHTFLLKKRFRYRVPDSAIQTGLQEEYFIQIEDKDGNKVTPIDPYLKFP